MKEPERQSLRSHIPAAKDEAAEAAAAVREMQRQQQSAAPPGADGGDDRQWTTATIHIPVDLLEALQQAAFRRASARRRANAKGRGGRASVSEVVVDLLTRHLDEIKKMG